MTKASAQTSPTRRRFLAGTLGSAAAAAIVRPRWARAQSVTLSMIGLAGHPSWLATKEMVKAYQEMAPNVEFELSEFDLPQINDKVNLDFQAKKGEYDIVWMNSAQTVGYWSEAGIVDAARRAAVRQLRRRTIS